MRTIDLLVVGASFAGLMCARTAAHRGLETAVIEAKPDPGARLQTTGILVKEADEEIDAPPHLTRPIHGVRLYSPNLASVDLFAPGYYFLTTDTKGLLHWLAAQAAAAGASMVYGKRVSRAERDGPFIVLPEFGIKTRFLVGADGARSRVARLFGLGRNKRFLIGVEREYDALPAVDPRFLHCFLDSRLAPGYLAWIAAAPGRVQAGLATAAGAKPNLARFISRSQHLFSFSDGAVVERRSGLIPVGGPVHPIGTENVLLIGDAAGHVSPLTGGGIRWALRDGRRAGQLIADRLTRLGPEPHTVLSGDSRSILMKIAIRRALELGPPGWLYNATLSTSPMRWLAQRIYFHRRTQSGESLTEFERQVHSASSRQAEAGEG